MNQPIDYFTDQELNPHKYPTTPQIDANLDELHERLNHLRAAYGRPLILSSCLRSQEQQDKLIAQGLSKASHSKHLIGAAADVSDSDGVLASWTLANIPILESIGLWCEDPKYTHGWVHFQIVPPASGHRFFIP